MPRKLRIQYPGAMYHVMSQGDRREDIFLDDVDPLLGEHSLQQDTAAARQELERRMEARRLESGDDQLWPREVGNAMPVLALAWVLSGDRQYLDAAREWALASTWFLGLQ